MAMKTRYIDHTSKCDICGATDLDVCYDMPYIGGHWAFICEKCREGRDHPAGIKLVKGVHPKSGIDFDEVAYAKGLDDEQIEAMLFDGDVECVDGCVVEPDGKCPHGYRSPLLILGII